MYYEMVLSALKLCLVFLILHMIQMKFLPQLAMKHHALLATLFVSSIVKSYLQMNYNF